MEGTSYLPPLPAYLSHLPLLPGFKCNVTGATSTRAVAPAVPATWCEDAASDCTTGARQLIYWNQADGNNIEVEGFDAEGLNKSPAYNEKLGWVEGE